MWKGLWVGVCLWVGLVAVYKVYPVSIQVLPLGGLLVVLGALAGGVLGGWRGTPPIETARWLDQERRLQERVSTALELGGQAPGEWSALVVADAARHMGRLDFRRMLPLRVPVLSRWVLLALVLGVGLGFVPEYRTRDWVQRQRDQESVQEAGKNLADVSRRLLEKRAPALEPTRQAVRAVGQLGEELTRNPLSRSEALREVARLTEKVQAQNREMARNPALRSMDRAARSADGNRSGTAEALQRQIESLQKSLGRADVPPDALEKLRRELEQARQMASNLSNPDSRAAEAARDNLAKALSSLARESQDLGAALSGLEEAIAALEAGQIQQVLQDLEAAAKDLDKLRDMAQALQQLQQEAARMGKDLGEQLQNGQAEAAIATLQKMVNQLKAGAMSEEALRAMREEVSKAIRPAGPYGKVPEHLKDAVSRMQDGQTAEAAQALADAAKELEDLLQQLADAESLQGALGALKRAQACIGNGKAWSLCQGTGFKPGGKPGRGVGTWAEEEGWIETPPQTGLWDNSGVERPDMDPRGVTDRGEGEVPEGMSPSSVKGQFQPGSQMPSITLRGVSLKGQSTVSVREAVQAAQSQAESALSQDQVPRAYQNSVKGYFDDLERDP